MSMLKRQGHEAHPLSEIFPLHEGQPLWDLAERIKAHGQREPIVMHEGKVLDGRRRELACLRAGVEPAYRQFGSRTSDNGDPLEFVYDMNYHRRHLGDGDRVLAAARYATAKGGGDRQGGKGPAQLAQVVAPTNAQAAEKFEVGEADVRRGKTILASGTPVLRQAVVDETITVSDAAKVAGEAPTVQDQAVADVKSGKARSAAGAVKKRKGSKKGRKKAKPYRIEPPDETDAEGTPIPVHAKTAFYTAKQIAIVCRDIDAIVKRVEEIARRPGGRLIRVESVKQQFMDAKGNLWANRATHICPYCHGKKGEKACECCKDEGWTAKHVYQQAPGVRDKAAGK
jgi:hypothetical protein